MMIDINNPGWYKNAIARVKQNIKVVEQSNYEEDEKKKLLEIYEKQLRKYKRKMKSFFLKSTY
ncbi:hypothetical protein [Mesonia sp. HuA40]|uniref:hypothetical protein n=1 Tax=Mesonia sp. HuA40 TaxID=2602761 RepID=UPI0011C85CC8|nr:hypothetical protein [Mesonia sp. HuA40]TXK73921.1 hypothetical protein FT993_03420 [Mesonia sp. HuA40]